MDNEQGHTEGVQRYVDRGLGMVEARNLAMATMRTKRFDTIAVHGLYGAQEALGNQGSIIEPAYLSSAQHFENSDHLEAALGYHMPAWGYTRIANPTVGWLESTLSLLEGYGYDGGVSAHATSSGMAAVFLATDPFLSHEFGTDPNFVTSVKVYGGTYQLFSERYGRDRGIDVRWVADSLDIDAWASQIDENTRFIYTEMPSNPGLAISDIRALADLAHRHGIPLIVDSTLTSPALMRPLTFGADIVVQSLSKIMGASGHAIAGAVIARHDIVSRFGADLFTADFATYVKLYPARDFGPSMSPMSALGLLSEIRSLRSRADAMSITAMRVAEFLSDHPGVERVTYPGLPGVEGHAVAKAQMHLVDDGSPRYGSMMSFEVAGGSENARNMFDRFSMIWRATDLGKSKTVAVLPCISTHQQQGEDARAFAGIPSNLVRLSVGLEHPMDIIEDLDQALTHSGAADRGTMSIGALTP